MNTNINKRRKNNKGEHIVHHHVPTTIADLPESLIHHITSSLSLRDIAGMSLCFKQWRNICYTTPYLTINIDKLCQNSYTSYESSCFLLMIFLNKLLIYRRSNVQRLALTCSRRYDSLRKCGFIDTLILKAIEWRLQELDLNIDIDNDHEWFVLPDEIFTLPSLTIFKLKLDYTELNLPHSVQSTNLHTLSFTQVVFCDDPLGVFPNDTSGASFLNQCPSLKTLTLEDCKGFTTLNVISSSLETLSITQTIDIHKSLDHLNISCDKLKTLYLNVNSSKQVAKSFKLSAPIIDSFQCKGVVWKSFIVYPFTSLKAMDATIYACSRIQCGDDDDVGAFVLDFVSKLLDHVSHATYLHLCNQSMQILHSKIDETPSFFLSNLEFLTLFTRTLSTGDSCSIMNILQRSPKTKTLRIIEDYMVKAWFKFKTDDEDNEYQQQTEFFHNLELVEMSLIGDGEANLELLKNLLKNGKALEQITIYYRPVPESSIPKRFSKKLGDFQKTSSSPLARLCFLPVWI